MQNELYRLLYYSRNRIGGESDALAAGIEDILAVSRANNARDGVTGALLFNAGCFGQVLEGPRAALEETFERIQQDERHGDVSLLTFEPAPGRAFDNWSMAFVGGSVQDAARYGAIAHDSGFDPSRLTGEALFEALERFTREDEQGGPWRQPTRPVA
jgi:hypothetical protein